MKSPQRNAAISCAVSKAFFVLALISGTPLAQKADLPDVRIGNQWKFAMYYTVPSVTPKASRGSTTFDVAVVGHEKVRVPAGEFDAFKLTATGSLRGTSPINSQYAGETTETYWYAPTARAIVKSVSHNPYLGTTTVELVEFRLVP